MFKALLSRFKAPLVDVVELTEGKQLIVIEALQKQLNERRIFELRQAKIIQDLRIANSRYQNQMDGYCDSDRISRLEVIELQDQQLKDKREIEALKAIVSNLRKQKVYAGQKFYDQNDHRAPTVYLCARFNQWYMVRQSNEAVPKIMHAERWQETYGHLVVLPQMNSNLKNLG